MLQVATNNSNIKASKEQNKKLKGNLGGSNMKLQLALDDITLEDAVELLDKVHPYVDIIEVGSPFIIEEGMRPVRIFKEKYPDCEILADTKIMDAGEYEAEETFKAGADYCTVLGVTDTLTIEGCVKAAKEYGHIGIISVGWDPGMFSLNRMYANAILPEGKDYTFWGKGVSQGHSDAIRRVEGVKDGKQYTIPVEAALEAVRNGEDPELTTRQKHTRECFVVLEEGADAKKVEEEIKTMPNYFSDYDTTVHFISQEELDRDHSKIPHGGFVLRSGCTGWEKENKHIIEYSLKLDSNPEFTSSVLVAYARAAYKLSKEGQSGCKTVFDIAPAYLSAKSGDELRASLL